MIIIPRCVIAFFSVRSHAELGSTTGKEAFLLTLHTFFLVLRTVLSVMVARLDGRIVRDLVGIRASWRFIDSDGCQVSANGKGFIGGLGWWFALAIPSTYTNAMVCSFLKWHQLIRADPIPTVQAGIGLPDQTNEICA